MRYRGAFSVSWIACTMMVLAGCQTTVVRNDSPEGKLAARQMLASARAMEVESAKRLALEGEVFFGLDPVKKTGYKYCGDSVRLANNGEFRRAIQEASKALYLGEVSGDHRLLAYAYRDLGHAYNLAGDLELAKSYSMEAIKHIGQSRRGKEYPILGPTYKTLGDVALREGDSELALLHYDTALKEVVKGDEGPRVNARITWILSSLSRASLVAGNDLEASRYLSRATSLAEYPNVTHEMARRLMPYLLRTRAEILMAQGRYRAAQQSYTEALSLSAGLDASYHDMWSNAGIARAYLALDDVPQALAAYERAARSGEAARLRFHSDEFKTGVFGSAQSVFNQYIDLLMASGQGEKAFQVSERGRARALLDMVGERARLSGGGDAFADPLGKPAAIKEIAAAIPSDHGLVSYHFTDTRVYAWLLKGDSITAHTLTASPPEVRALTSEYRRRLRTVGSGSDGWSRKLHEVLLSPLPLSSVIGLIIVPHGPLHHIPFQALGGRDDPLIARWPVVYSPSASAYAMLARRRAPDRTLLLALANPDLGAKEMDLPGAAQEVAELSKNFTQPSVYYRKAATDLALMSGAPENLFVHVAAHAEIDPIDPLYSSILLAATPTTDGVLEAHEVYGLDLRKTWMVALSACDTGLGKVTAGDEIWGFYRTFLSAGVSTLVVTLWPVSDEATRVLMSEFYRQLDGNPTPVALQRAQDALRKDARFADEYYWAGFNLVGSPG